MGELLPAEVNRLRDCEKVIETGLTNFFEVGEALAEIQESKLYRLTHSSFKAYCSEKWDLGDRQVRYLIQAAEVVEDTNKSGSALPLSYPSSQRQAIALGKVPVEKRREVLAEASKNGKLTGAKITTAAKKLSPPKPPKNGAQKGDPRIWARWDDLFGKLTRLADEMGREFPHALNHREITKHLNQAHDLKEAWQRAKR